MDSFNPQDTQQAVALGTTIMAASFPGGVVLGADSRTSTGSYVANRVTNKLTQLADKVFVCRSGSAADTQAISGVVEAQIAQHQMELGSEVDVKTVANLAMHLLYENKNMLQAGMIVAGWDDSAGASVFALPLGGTLIKVPFSIGGSGSAYIYGFCDRNWKPDMTAEQCHAFVVQAVTLAIGRDGSSGGCVRTVTVTKDGAKRAFVPNTELRLTGESAAPPAAVSAAA